MKFATFLIVLGIGLLAYAFSIEPYKDRRMFDERHFALSDGQDREFSKLRSEILTPKYQLQDCGGTLLALAAGVILVSRKGWRGIKSPNSRLTLFAIAFAAPFLSVGAFIFDLYQGFARCEFPHWADSFSISLMSVPFNLILLLIWSGVHLIFLRAKYQPAPLILAGSREANWWLLTLTAITVLFVAFCASFGQYWYAIPAVVWGYFYMSLAAGRLSGSPAELLEV